MNALTWSDVLELASTGSPEPDRVIEKSDEEWQALLTAEQYRVMRLHGTEQPFDGNTCGSEEKGTYACAACGALLFEANDRFESGTGWPSFSQPLRENAVSYAMDESYGMSRVAASCMGCAGHLGHVFPDGPGPGGLRFCLNAVALQKVVTVLAKATFGGGCFWCTEAMFQQLKGVESVVSGYSGGASSHPSYTDVCSGKTGHAEVIELDYESGQISFEELVRVHLGSHDPTSLNRQGADIGTQYRSVIFYRNEDERECAERVLSDYAETTGNTPVTELAAFEQFYPAEDLHQNYYRLNPQAGYCEAVIAPKLAKFRGSFRHLFSTEL